MNDYTINGRYLETVVHDPDGNPFTLKFPIISGIDENGTPVKMVMIGAWSGGISAYITLDDYINGNGGYCPQYSMSRRTGRNKFYMESVD